MNHIKKSFILMAALGCLSSLYASRPGDPTSGPRTMPSQKLIGGKGGIYHGPAKQGPTTLNFPFFNSFEIKGSKGERGTVYPILRVAFLQDKAGNVTYFTNVSSTMPNSNITNAYTLNFATLIANNKSIPLHGVAITPEVITKIKNNYNMLIDTIPSIALNASTIQNKTIGELWTMGLETIGTWFPKPVYTA